MRLYTNPGNLPSVQEKLFLWAGPVNGPETAPPNGGFRYSTRKITQTVKDGWECRFLDSPSSCFEVAHQHAARKAC